jgi:hypothetical protein
VLEFGGNGKERRRMQDLIDNLTRDQLISASAATYTPEFLQQNGLNVTPNYSHTKSRFIGDPKNPIYPDIVAWRYGGTLGIPEVAVIIEKIELENSIEKNWKSWPQYANSGAAFFLVVPATEREDVLSKLTALGIVGKTRLQTYTKNAQGQYQFQDAM